MGGWESYGGMMLVTDGRMGELWWYDVRNLWEDGRVMVG